MKTRLVVFLFMLALLAVTAGCTQREAETVGAEPARLKIGFSMATLLEDRWLQDRDIFLAKAQQRELDVIIKNANRDSSTQLQQVREMLAQGIDVLVIAPNDSNSEAICVQAAKSMNVPVVIYDRFINNSLADVYISFDNIKVGVFMGEYCIKNAPTGGYLLVNGPQSDNNCIMIREGYMEVLQPYIDNGDIVIVDETWTEGWVREIAYDFTSEVLQHHSDELAAVISENDSLAWGVTDALAEAHVDHPVVVVGMDADLIACQRIVKGRQGMTVYKPIQKLVEEALNACEKLARGEKIDATSTLFDGQREVPHIAIDVVEVNRDTIEQTVIEDGFHLRDEVFESSKRVPKELHKGDVHG